MTRDQWARDQASIVARLGQQKTALAHVEEALREQRQDLADVLAKLQEGQALADREADSEIITLRAEIEHLQQMLAEQAQPSGPTEAEWLQVKNENEELKQMLTVVERERE